jgi:hypothetical protein
MEEKMMWRGLGARSMVILRKESRLWLSGTSNMAGRDNLGF